MGMWSIPQWATLVQGPASQPKPSPQASVGAAGLQLGLHVPWIGTRGVVRPPRS